MTSGAYEQKNLVSPSLVSGIPLQVSAEYSQDRLIVRYDTESPRAEASMESVQAEANELVGASVVEDMNSGGLPGMQVVQVTGSSLDEAMKLYNASPNVLYVEPDYKISLSPVETTGKTENPGELAINTARYPNDPGFQYLWGLQNTGQAPFYGTADADIDAPEAWSVTTGSSSVIVGIIDTGVDYTHPDLSANIWQNTAEVINGKDDDKNGYIDDIRGWNFASKNNNPMDDNGHGTHCAGTIAAIGNNGIGITGTAWNIRIMPLKFLNAKGTGYTSDAISAILYAKQKGVSILSNSWSGTGYSQALKDAIDSSPAVFICAAGNSGADSDVKPQYPAAFTSGNIISVAATDYKDQLASFSNYGVNSVDIAAPGVNIYSTSRAGNYQYLSGTSMAVPHVTGAAALLKSKNPSITGSEIRNAILRNGDALPSLSGKVSTGSRLNTGRTFGQTVSPVAPGTKPTIKPTNKPVASRTNSPGDGSSSKPIAGFSADPTNGKAPFRVQFIDQSSGNPDRWTWSFGDGGFSYQKNPSHVYKKKGIYSVRLTVKRGGYSSSSYRERLIAVT
ncbi:MAG: S8 family serine peptidase [Methanospirillum sp.]|nr:S8 family serine peptidase [Methanospirillum sp.]